MSTNEVDLNRCPVDLTDVEGVPRKNETSDGQHSWTTDEVTVKGVPMRSFIYVPHPAKDSEHLETVTVAGVSLNPLYALMLANQLTKFAEGKVERTDDGYRWLV